MSTIAIIQHVPFEDAAYISTWLSLQNITPMIIRCYENDQFPPLSSVDGLVIMGGPMSVHDGGQYPWLDAELVFIKKAILANKKILGVCLGAQIIGKALGAEITCQEKEIGWFDIQKTATGSALEKRLPERIKAFHWHGETFSLPPNCVRLYQSEGCDNQAFLYKNNVLALQFHLESTAQSVKNIVHHCADEIQTAPMIQTKSEILENTGFNEMHKMMSTFLQYLFKS